MTNQKSKNKDDINKRIEELRARIEKLIKKTKRMEIELEKELIH
jgi:hypothetical protein